MFIYNNKQYLLGKVLFISGIYAGHSIFEKKEMENYVILFILFKKFFLRQLENMMETCGVYKQARCGCQLISHFLTSQTSTKKTNIKTAKSASENGTNPAFVFPKIFAF